MQQRYLLSPRTYNSIRRRATISRRKGRPHRDTRLRKFGVWWFWTSLTHFFTGLWRTRVPTSHSTQFHPEIRGRALGHQLGHRSRDIPRSLHFGGGSRVGFFSWSSGCCLTLFTSSVLYCTCTVVHTCMHFVYYFHHFHLDPFQ